MPPFDLGLFGTNSVLCLDYSGAFGGDGGDGCSNRKNSLKTYVFPKECLEKKKKMHFSFAQFRDAQFLSTKSSGVAPPNVNTELKYLI